MTGVLVLVPMTPSVAQARTLPLAAAASTLQLSADLGHGEKVSRAASGRGRPVVPEGCRNFGHWVSSEARGTTCEDDPRPGHGKRHRPDVLSP